MARVTGREAPIDLREVLHRATEVAIDVARPRSEAVDREAIWPDHSIRALQQAGLGGLVVPPEHGGLGYGLAALAQVCEVVGRECPSSAICFGMHCVGAAVISAKVTPAQAERYLAPIAAGEHLTTLSLSEPATGAHFYFPQTRIERESDDVFRVNGGKSFVTNGSHADSYVISGVTVGSDAPMGEFSCLILPDGAPGLEWGPKWTGLGMRGNDSRNMTLTDTPVPRADLLGQEGDELWYVFEVIAPYFLIAMAGTYLGVAAAAVDEAIQSDAGRTAYAHSGRGPAREPVIQHRIGTIWSAVERARRLIFSAAHRADAGDPDALPAVLACKAEVSECATQVANEAMTLAGGAAYRDNARLPRLLRDARAAHVMAPTTDILRTWTGRALLGQSLLTD